MAAMATTQDETLRRLVEETEQCKARITELENENKKRRNEIAELNGEFPEDEPETEDPDLIFFYRISCPFTARARPELKCLESHLKNEGRTRYRLRKLEVERNQENLTLLDEVDKDLCGGVPFFYNKKTGAHVCGARQCAVLKEWAKMEPKESQIN